MQIADTLKMSSCQTDEFITERNIVNIIDHANSNARKGGDVQIQVYIMDYKNRKFPDFDPMKELKID